MDMKRFLIISLLCFSVFIAVEAQDTTTEKPLFIVGEELEYSMKWGFFKVGSGFLRVEAPTEVDGIPCYHLRLSVTTNSFADVIYKVRNEFHSYVSIQDPRVIQYRINQHESSTHRDATVFFDWENLTATYQRDGEDPKEPVEIKANTWDPLSVVYYSRSVLDDSNSGVSLPATDGKKFINIDIKNLGIEKLKTQLGSFKVFKVEPNTKEMKGVFQKSKDSNIFMWYSLDENRYPILIKSKVIVGSFVAELKGIKNTLAE
jgi:hypothetical protein